IALFSLTMIVSLASGSLVKGVLSGMIGCLISFVGIAPITSFSRFTFGVRNLSAGFSILPMLIGFFAVAEILQSLENKNKKQDLTTQEFHIKGFGFTREDVKGQGFNFWVSTMIGTGVGILPGLGGSICNLLAYSVCRGHSKYPEKYGTGIVDGLIASEASNNACTGGAMVPLLTLGLPGDNTTALILAGFMIHGITPGPLLFRTQGPLVYGIFASLLVANLLMLIVEFVGIRAFIRILQIPKNILLPVIVVFCVVGAYANNNRPFDVLIMMIFGILGWVMKKADLPIAPTILAFILCPTLETNLRRGLMKSQGSFVPFITSPISLVFIILAVFMLVWNLRKEFIRGSKKNA
ncbi:MAG: tripartite tricarboxylate transporter permease, partial [Lachnospiraceae bacterium]|nr:tripartite tricarboxylate transporter permease [Lachnospiraceae bacterium]